MDDRSSVLGLVSVVAGIAGLLGQGCCCVPIVSFLAMLIVPVCITTALVAGGLGASRGGPDAGTAKIGLAIGIVDLMLVGVQATFLLLYAGALTVGSF